MQIDQRGIFGRAAAGLVQPLAIQAQGRGGRGKQPGRFKQVFFFQAAGLRDQLGRVLAHRGFERVKAAGVGRHVSGVNPAFPQHDVQQAVEQRHVGAGLQRQVQIGDFGGVGAARVADNDLQRRVRGLRVFNAPKQNRVRKRRVAAGDEQALGVFQVVVAGRRRIGPQRLFVTRDRAAHAQARVGVDVVRADQALGQLVEDVIVLGQQLAGNVKTHRVRAVLTDDSGKFFGGEVQRAVPAHALGRGLAAVALHGVQQPGLLRHGG